MPDMEVTASFEVYRAKCGAGICNNTSVDYCGNIPKLRIEPCERCLDQAYTEGDSEGYDRGGKEGHKAGYDEGYQDARNEFKETYL